MLYFAVESLSLVVIIVILSFKGGKFNLKSGLMRLKDIIMSVVDLPSKLVKLKNDSDTLSKQMYNHYESLNDLEYGLLKKIDSLRESKEEQKASKLENDLHSRRLAELESYIASQSTHLQDLSDRVQRIQGNQNKFATQKDVVGVIEAVKSLEVSLESRLTPTKPVKGSRAKLKVVKKATR